MGLPLLPEQGARLLAYLDAMLEENRRVNLTSIRDREDGVVRHVLDSLSVIGLWKELAGETPPRRVLDLGTGGGFPGVPLALMWPDTHVLCVDSTGKKVRAIENALAAIGGVPNVEPLQARVVQLRKLEPRLRDAVDLGVARAVGRTANVLREFRGLLARGGWIFSMKGPEPPADEIDEARELAERVGFEVPRPRTTSVPWLLARTVLVYRRK